MKRRKTYNKYLISKSTDEKKAKILDVGSGEGSRDAIFINENGISQFSNKQCSTKWRIHE